jgi:hypothetical protein
MPNETIHEVKRPSAKALNKQILVSEIALLLGLKKTGKHFHCHRSSNHKNGDSHASVGVYTATNKLHCFVCGYNLGVIDLVMDLKGMDVGSAIRWLGEQYPVSRWIQEYEVIHTKVVNKSLPDYGKVRSYWAGRPGHGKWTKENRLLRILKSSKYKILPYRERSVLLTIVLMMPLNNPVVETTKLRIAKTGGHRYKQVQRAEVLLKKSGWLTIDSRDRTQTSIYRLLL